MRVVASQQVEGSLKTSGTESQLGTGDVISDDRVVAVDQSKFSDLGGGFINVPHRCDDLGGDDGPSRGLGLRHALGKAVTNRLHGRLQRQPFLQVLFGGPAGLGVNDAVGGLVQHELSRHSHQLITSLHGGGGVGETLQISHQGTGVGGFEEPPAQFRRVSGR